MKPPKPMPVERLVSALWSCGAPQREAVDGIDGVLREARRWSAKVIAAVGIIPVPVYFWDGMRMYFPSSRRFA